MDYHRTDRLSFGLVKNSPRVGNDARRDEELVVFVLDIKSLRGYHQRVHAQQHSKLALQSNNVRWFVFARWKVYSYVMCKFLRRQVSPNASVVHTAQGLHDV